MDVASLQVIIQTKGVEAAQKELDKLSGTAGKAEKSVSGLASSIKTLGTVATIGAIASLGKQAISTADSMNLLDARLKLATNSLEEFTSQQKELFNISKASFSELKGITDLYIKLDPALKRLGASTQAVNSVTSSFAKGLQVGGASAQESASAILQFSQAMGSGVLRGEEFNAIAEASPKLMKYMADGMGAPTTAMRQLAQDGKLTADVVSIALLKMTQDIDKDFKELPVTMGKAFTNIKTDLSKLSQEFDKTSGITKALSDVMVDLSDDLYKYSGNIFTSLNDVSNIVKSSVNDISMLSKEVIKLLEVFDNASKDGTGLGLFKSSLLGLKIVIDTMYVGLNNSIVLMTELARTSKNFFEDEKLSKDFLTRVNSQILTLDDLEKKYIETYKTIIKTQEGFKKPTQEEITIDLQEEIKTIESRGKALKAEDDKKKEATKQQEKTQKDAIKLAEEWAKRKIELVTETAIAEQDEMSKPYILLQAQYEADLKEFGSQKGAKEDLERKYQAELQKLNQETVKKFEDGLEKEAKKSAEWQVKMLEANEKYNDEIIKMQDEMYGTDTTVEAWYNNQLEYLGKLSQEAGATAEELQTLLDKIETLKAMKLQKQTISFKVEQSFYSSFENNLADSIEDAFNGDLNFKKFFKNIGNDLMKTFSSSLASVGTNMLRGNYSALAALGGASASLVGTSISAEDISGIMNSGGTFDSATNTITTSGGTKIGLNESGGGSVSSTGSDIMSLVNTVSTLKTAYTLATAGLSSTVMSGFSGLSNLTGISGISQFGYGFTNPFAAANPMAGLYGSGVPQLSGLSSIGSTAGGALVGGAVGYGAGYLGDKLMGANTYASTTGAIGGAAAGGLYAAGVISGPVGWAVLGASLLLGGLFGKKEVTDVGYQFFDNMTALDEITTDTVKQYSDWEKNSWFSSKSGTDYSNLSSKEMKQIESVFDTYDYLLGQLGDTDKIWLDAGKYTGATFGDALAKNFISAFSDIPTRLQEITTDGRIYHWYNDYLITNIQQLVTNPEINEIYQAWADYATSVNTTVMEAFTTMIGGFIQSKRTFEVWALGDSIEALAKKAEFATADLNQIKDTLGATGTTVESFLSDFDKAVKESFTPETISQWESLGTALMTATDAQNAYKNAILTTLNTSLNSWNNVLNSVQGAIDNLNPTFKTFTEIANTALSLDNYSTLLNEVEKTRQNEISALTNAYNLRITQLNKEKTYFEEILQYVEELTMRMTTQVATLGTFFYAELQKAKDNFAKGSDVDITSLSNSASSYLDSVKKNSATQRDYFFEVAKVRNELSEFGTDLAEGGSLEGIENAILLEQNTLAQKLDAINQTALAILQGYKGTATGAISGLTSQINTVQAIDPSITAAYANILGRTPEAEGGAYWQEQLTSGNLNTSNITEVMAAAAVKELYQTVLGRAPDAEGQAYWEGLVTSGAVNPTQIDDLFKEAAKTELGFANGGYTGNIGVNDIAGVVHGQEYVVNAQTTKDLGLNGSGGAFADMVAELASLRKLMVKLVSDNTKQLSTQRAILGERVAI